LVKNICVVVGLHLAPFIPFNSGHQVASIFQGKFHNKGYVKLLFRAVLTDVHDILHHDVGCVFGPHGTSLQAGKPALHHCTNRKVLYRMIALQDYYVQRFACISPLKPKLV
jgi:hypothetical protein